VPSSFARSNPSHVPQAAIARLPVADVFHELRACSPSALDVAYVATPSLL